MSNARENILKRLRAHQSEQRDSPELEPPEYTLSKEEKITQLTRQMQMVRTEVHRINENQWIDWLNNELPQREIKKLLTGNTAEGIALKKAATPSLDVQHYTANIDEFKQELFNNYDAGFTTTRGGIADTGSLILWPDENEPRLLSLVPPVHIALLKADMIFETLTEAIHRQQWKDNMPANALLISGPSKTADIQQTLAYGIHGPKELIVLILESS